MPPGRGGVQPGAGEYIVHLACSMNQGVQVGGEYTTCEYCDPEDKLCKPGCETDENCMTGAICAHNV